VQTFRLAFLFWVEKFWGFALIEEKKMPSERDGNIFWVISKVDKKHPNPNQSTEFQFPAASIPTINQKQIEPKTN
jgi:hypothetical protein